MSTTKYILNAKPRTVTGKKVKLLRLEHILPSHIYGDTKNPVNVQFDEKEFLSLFKKAGETSVLHVQVEGEKESRPVLVTNYTVDPIHGRITHVDLLQVNLNVKVTANVPIELEGESEAVKAGGVLIQLMDEIEVEALPNDLPEKFILNISALAKIGDELKVSNLIYDKNKVSIEMSADEALVVVNEPKVEVEPVVAEPVEVETTVQGAKKEGDEAEAAAGAADAGKGGAAVKGAQKIPAKVESASEKKGEK